MVSDILNPVGWTVSVSGIFTFFPGIPGTPSVGFDELEKCLVASVLPDDEEPLLVMVSSFLPEEYEYLGCGAEGCGTYVSNIRVFLLSCCRQGFGICQRP